VTMRISASDGYKRKALDRWSRTCVPPPHTGRLSHAEKKLKSGDAAVLI
jgi:hypothetical protein